MSTKPIEVFLTPELICLNIKKSLHLDKIQSGKDPSDWKPMQGIGSGVKEIRISKSEGIYRVIYVAKFEESVYVLHAFQKKTQKTSPIDLEAAKRSYKKILEERGYESYTEF